MLSRSNIFVDDHHYYNYYNDRPHWLAANIISSPPAIATSNFVNLIGSNSSRRDQAGRLDFTGREPRDGNVCEPDEKTKTEKQQQQHPRASGHTNSNKKQQHPQLNGMSNLETIRELEQQAPAAGIIDANYQDLAARLAGEQAERKRRVTYPAHSVGQPQQNHNHKPGYEPTEEVAATNLVSRHKRHHENDVEEEEELKQHQQTGERQPDDQSLGCPKKSVRLDDERHEQLQRQLLQSAIDNKHLVKTISDLPTFVTIEGYRVASYSLAGEPFLCLAQLLQYLKQEFPIEQVVEQFEESMTNFTDATPKQIDGFVKASVLPASATNCALIKRSDADRICLRLFDRCPKNKWTDIVDLCSKPKSGVAGSEKGATNKSYSSLNDKRESTNNERNMIKIDENRNKHQQPEEVNGNKTNHCDDKKNPDRNSETNTQTETNKLEDQGLRGQSTGRSAQKLPYKNEHDHEPTGVNAVNCEPTIESALAKREVELESTEAPIAATTTTTKAEIETETTSNEAHDLGTTRSDSSGDISCDQLKPSTSEVATIIPTAQCNDHCESEPKGAAPETGSPESPPNAGSNDQLQKLSTSPKKAHLFEAEAQGIILDLAKAVTSTLMIHVYHRCSGKSTGLFYPSLARHSESECVECTVCHIMLAPRRFVGHTHGNKENRVCHWGFNSYNWRHYIRLSKKQPMNNLDDDELLVQFNLLLSVNETSNCSGATDDVMEKIVEGSYNEQKQEQQRRPSSINPISNPDYNVAVKATTNAARPYGAHRQMVTPTDQRHSHYISHMFDSLRASVATTATSSAAALALASPMYNLGRHHMGRSVVDNHYGSLYSVTSAQTYSPPLHHPQQRSMERLAPSTALNGDSHLHLHHNHRHHPYASFKMPQSQAKISTSSPYYGAMYGVHLDSLDAQNMTPLELLSSLSGSQFLSSGGGGAATSEHQAPFRSLGTPSYHNGPVNGLSISLPTSNSTAALLGGPSHLHQNQSTSQTLDANFAGANQASTSRAPRDREAYVSDNLARYLKGKGLSPSLAQDIVDNTLHIVRKSNSLF